MNKQKRLFLSFYLTSIVCLIIGASFHEFRIHPENESTYKVGVIVGIVMISSFVVLFILGTIYLFLYKKQNNNQK